MTMPLLADKNMAISRAYGVLKEDEGLRFEKICFIMLNKFLPILIVVSASEACL